MVALARPLVADAPDTAYAKDAAVGHPRGEVSEAHLQELRVRVEYNMYMCMLYMCMYMSRVEC
jgi:hypothetical protein